MKTNNRTGNISIAVQAVVWVIIILARPLTVLFPNMDFRAAWMALQFSARMLGPMLLLYVINYAVLVPYLFFNGRRKWAFVVLNLAYILARTIITFVSSMHMMHTPPGSPMSVASMALYGSMAVFFVNTATTMAALGCRFVEHYYTLKQDEALQKQKAAEAELTWLKSQLNPHFLFNTLNNISSLTQIDAEKAQESIAQLSDLLRYTLYETEAEMVPLSGEVEFLNNYIDLMSLRCNGNVSIGKDFREPSGAVKVAPLLFISMVENAFKHGVNARKDSFVNFSLFQDGNDLVFESANSMFEKSGTDRAGSGIGIENLRRRLELIYPERYRYDIDDRDGVYKARVTLKGIC